MLVLKFHFAVSENFTFQDFNVVVDENERLELQEQTKKDVIRKIWQESICNGEGSVYDHPIHTARYVNLDDAKFQEKLNQFEF